MWLRLQRDRDRGAVAVEFALVVVVLVPLLFGIIEYGLWFNQLSNVRDGVRNGARQAAVANWGDPSVPCDPPLNDVQGAPTQPMLAAMCIVQDRIGVQTQAKPGIPPGDVWVRVRLQDAAGTETTTWDRTSSLAVCAMARYTSVSGLIPVPGDLMTGRVVMTVENPEVNLGPQQGGFEAPPAGADWSWCR